MRTVIYPPTGVLGLGRYRTVGVVARHLGPVDGPALVEILAEQGIPLRVVDTGRVVHLYALRPMSTVDEVRALRAVSAETDMPLVFHQAVDHG